MLINIRHNYYQISHLHQQYDLSKQEEGVIQTQPMLGSPLLLNIKFVFGFLIDGINLINNEMESWHLVNEFKFILIYTGLDC